MNPRRINHIHFTVTDLKESIGFYEALGLTLADRQDHGGESAQMSSRDGGMVVDLNLVRKIDNPGYNHYAIEVDDIEAACIELVEKGFRVDGPIFVEATKRKLATIRDPDGTLVQLVEAE